MFVLYNPKTETTVTFSTEAGGLVWVNGEPIPVEDARERWRKERASGAKRVDESPHVDVIRGAFGTTYSVVGTPEAVAHYRERLYADYHPCGYGTHLRPGEEITPGVIRARGHRSNSCD